MAPNVADILALARARLSPRLRPRLHDAVTGHTQSDRKGATDLTLPRVRFSTFALIRR